MVLYHNQNCICVLLRNELKQRKDDYNNEVATMKKDYQEMKKYIENKRVKVDKLTLTEKELTKKCEKLSKRVNKMRNELNKSKNRNKNTNNNSQIDNKTRESDRDADSEPSSSSDSSVQESKDHLMAMGGSPDKAASKDSQQQIGVGNSDLDNQNQVKDKDKKAIRKRKYVSPPKLPNPNSNSPTTTNVKPISKKRRTISTFENSHQKMVEKNNSVFNNKSSQITLEQAADGYNQNPSANLLPSQSELKEDNNSTMEEEDDDDIALDNNAEIAKYMSTKVDDSNNNDTNGIQNNAVEDNQSEDDI